MLSDLRGEIGQGDQYGDTANEVPDIAERVQHEEGRVRLLDVNGETLRSFELTADGRLIMPRGSMLAVLPTPPSRPGRPSIGVTMAPVDPALAAQLGQRAEDVVLVTEVGDGTPAATAGIQRYDVIHSINGQSPVSLSSEEA